MRSWVIIVFRFVKEIVKGLMFIHAASIIHLDLKPQNIMVAGPAQEFRWEERYNLNLRIKLIDFGTAKRLHNGVTNTGLCGTVRSTFS